MIARASGKSPVSTRAVPENFSISGFGRDGHDAPPIASSAHAITRPKTTEGRCSDIASTLPNDQLRRATMVESGGTGSGSGRVAVVAGASGLVGTSLVRQLLDEGRVARVVTVVRKPIDAGAHGAKLEQRVVPDFAKLDVDTMPKDIDDAYCCLGTTMKKAGSKQAFLNVDFDAVVAFARAARQAGARRFVVVSALGADPRSVTFYLD